MKTKNIDTQAAFDYVGTYFADLMAKFVSARANVPSWSADIDAGVQKYFDGIEHWIKGNLEYGSVYQLNIIYSLFV